MGGRGQAFAKGGLGCLAGFLAIGLVAVMFGGTMYIDMGGAVLLFLIGGVMGLTARWFYDRGRASGSGSAEPSGGAETPDPS